ncbi:hypothetical protein BDB00DRAFT_869582 [Zychaea mexicana]|uniref:uncharacterized protein n=1 Tax=Zychaea mexicana TaxID=64656 RepID=UPI0022FEFBBD|nr:uncharacterized protein BDB00DRAFT_869582 [Zychaea mexicana]KAI9496284.1 hypothetical protein BDB00DRAFT_869582 [Zychaea mexicana]
MDLDALLAQEIEDLNRDSEEDRRVKEAVILDKRDPNKILGPDDDYSSDDSSSENNGNSNNSSSGNTTPRRRTVRYCDEDDDDYYEDDLALRDPELFRTTELNRQIILDEQQQQQQQQQQQDGYTPQRKKSVAAIMTRPPELVFSDPPTTVTEPDRIIVTFHYGQKPDKPVVKSRKYMMACDFGEESMYAMNWALGTMLRDGDQVHVATVVTPDEDIDDMDDDEKYRLWQEMDRKSKNLISKVRSKLEEMLLYNITIVIYSIAGQTKESLLELIYSLPLTMVVCGSREKGAFKGLLMGSVSTFLVHNAPVPVSVVRPQKKEKKSKKKMTAAQKLSQSVRNGQLKVDEAAGAAAPNVHNLP